MRNPFLLGLLGLAVVGITLGLLFAVSLQSWLVGMGFLLLGGAALIGWLIAAALAWNRRTNGIPTQQTTPQDGSRP